MSGSFQGPPTATMTLSAGASAPFPLSTAFYPQEGSRGLGVQYNWTNQAAFTEDLSQVVAHGIETVIQSVWVDNSECTQGVIILVAGSGQKIAVPASSQGVFPIFFSGAQGFQIYTSAPLAAAVTRLILLNVPCVAGPWHI